MNNKSADKQVHKMKASNSKNLFQKLLWFLYILSNSLEGKTRITQIFKMRN